MNQVVKEMWADLLESRYYLQGHGAMHVIKEGRDYFCPLGVLVDLYQKMSNRALCTKEIKVSRDIVHVAYGEEGSVSLLPDEVREWAELSTGSPLVTLASGRQAFISTLNDSGDNFEYIARVIRTRLE